MSENNAPWVGLAARVVRVALMRKDVGYAELAKRLAAFGIRDDEKGLAARVAVGRVRLELFLQILEAVDSELPTIWCSAMESAQPWETRAKEVIRCELNQIPPFSVDELASRLAQLGAGFTHKTLVAHISSGNLSLPDFLKCLVILRSRSLDAFVEYRDLVSAAHLQIVTVDNADGCRA
ncbi:DUF6471 domain-containing protein [Pseudoduganella sp. R-31]|uniref:DUF6471 domain-containing protein n=1 Tax=Pseudoduganella sp. R-31 TaxID=3404060 RepID=UPI003CED66D9